MIALGLDHGEQLAFEAGLLDDHQVRITARILTLEQRIVGELTGTVLTGQVDVDVTADVRRTAQITLLDPDNSLGIDVDTPYSAGMMANRMLQLLYGVKSQQLPRWVDVPIFTGPITSTDRDGDIVTMSAHGKEALLLEPCSLNLVQRKGTRKTDALDYLLRAGGETHRSITPHADKLTGDFVVGGKEAIWPRAVALAQGITGTYTLDYDGRGTAMLRDTTTPVVWTFRGGDGGSLLNEPKFSADTSSIKNQVVVSGGIPAGSKRRVVAVANAQAAHPFSAKNMGRDGRPRYIREDIEEDSITVQEVAQTLANNRLWQLLQAGTDATWDSAVIPHLEPWDMVRVEAGGQSFATPAGKFSIPLTTDGVMTHGRHWVMPTVNGFRPTRAKNPRIPKPKKAPAKPKKAPAKSRAGITTRKGR